MPDDVDGQLANLFHHVGEMLEAAGADWRHVVKMTFYVPDLAVRDAINGPWAEHFPDPASRPARHTQVAPAAARPSAATSSPTSTTEPAAVPSTTSAPTSEGPMARTGGELLVEGLRRWGVDVVFGLPGVQLDWLFDALAREPAIRVLHTRHEQATSYMADGYARVTGRVGVCAVVPGPGVLNAGAGLATAYACGSRGAVPGRSGPVGRPRAGPGRAARAPGPAGGAARRHGSVGASHATR